MLVEMSNDDNSKVDICKLLALQFVNRQLKRPHQLLLLLTKDPLVVITVPTVSTAIELTIVRGNVRDASC